jgi:hypothetical protein
MADENPLQNLPDVSDVVEEVVTLSADPIRLVAKKTVNAYAQAALAAAIAVPLVTSGGVPTLSNVQARKPDESIPNQPQPTAEPMRTLMVAETSVASFYGAWIVRTVEKK